MTAIQVNNYSNSHSCFSRSNGNNENGKEQYNIVITGIENKSLAMKKKDYYENKGFMRVFIFDPGKIR